MFARSEAPFPGSPFASRRCVGFTLRGALSSLLALAFIGGLLTSCGGSTQEAEPGSTGGEQAKTGGSAPDMSKELEEKDVLNYMAALKELHGLGALSDQQLSDDPSELGKLSAAFSLPGKWQAVLKKHGFDNETYAQVHVAVIGALGALMSEDARKKFEEQKKKQAKQMEQMKKLMTPEQIAEMEKGMAKAQEQMLSMYDSVPKENIELARKYKDQLEAVFKK